MAARNDLLDCGGPGRLVLRLFGGFEASRGESPLPRTRTRKEVSLLSLLALRKGQPADRSWLAGTLWPDSSEEQALAYLRSSLYNLRKVLGPDSVRLQSPSPRTVSLDLDGAHFDVLEFDRCVEQSEPASLRRAIDLHCGPLLADCIEEWLLPEREAREQSFLQALETLAESASRSGNHVEAARHLRRAVAEDPFRESCQIALMDVLAASGDRASAMMAYRQFRLRLSEELRATPAPETTALYQRIRTESEPHHVAATADEFEGDSGPARAARSRAPGTHLPAVSTLVGREMEVSDICALFSGRNPESAGKRFVTLTGSGGIGKTRLAIAAAEKLAADLTDGVKFVDLALLTDGALAAQAVADSVGVREERDRPLTETLAEFLAHKELLLVLDNCEHVLRPSAWLAESLLKKCPALRILATSRQPMGTAEEAVFRVPPLGVPPLDSQGSHPPELAALLRFESVRLFVERAMDVLGSFTVTTSAAPAVMRICQRLEGIPLAIELAAARVNALSVEQIAGRLNESFGILSRGNKAAPTRQLTLTALIDWSHDLLNDSERALFRGLSVFAGGWNLELAEEIFSESDSRCESLEVLDLLSELIDRSLVVMEARADGSVRYRFLETIRQYAAEKLRLAGETERIRGRHAASFMALAEKAEDGLAGSEQRQWLDNLEVERDNLRAALKVATESGGESALRITGALRLFWDIHGPLSEGRRWCTAALDHPLAAARSIWRAKSLNTAGLLAFRQGDHSTARAHYEESLSIRTELGDKTGISGSLNNLGMVAFTQGDHSAAQAYYHAGLAIDRELDDRRSIGISLANLSNLAYSRGEYETAWELQQESLTIRRELGDQWGIGLSLGNLGSIAFERGDIESAQRLQEESLAIRKELDDPWNTALALSNLGLIAHYKGDFASSRRFGEESLVLREKIGNRSGVATCRNNLGRIEFETGDLSAARRLHEECLSVFLELDERSGIAESLEFLAPVMAAQGAPERAAIMWGAAHQLRQRIGEPMLPSRRQAYDYQLKSTRTEMGEPAFTSAWDLGKDLTMEQVVDIALNHERPCERK